MVAMVMDVVMVTVTIISFVSSLWLQLYDMKFGNAIAVCITLEMVAMVMHVVRVTVAITSLCCRRG